MSASAESLALQFVANILRDELRHQEIHFDRLDRLYSEFFFVQNDYVRFLHRIGDITAADRDRQWFFVDEQMREWDERFGAWRMERFHLTEAIARLQTRLRELHRSKEVSRDAA